MFSMITEPPTRIGSCRPISVTTGISAFLITCRRMINRSRSPFAQAVRMKSWRSTSSIMVRVMRITVADR